MAERKTENQAAEVQPDPVAAVPQLRLSDSTPSPASRPSKPLETGGQGKATVRVGWPVDRFEHGIAGVEAITAEGVEVERSKAKDLLDAAAQHGIRLEEVDSA